MKKEHNVDGRLDQWISIWQGITHNFPSRKTKHNADTDSLRRFLSIVFFQGAYLKTRVQETRNCIIVHPIGPLY